MTKKVMNGKAKPPTQKLQPQSKRLIVNGVMNTYRLPRHNRTKLRLGRVGIKEHGINFLSQIMILSHQKQTGINIKLHGTQIYSVSHEHDSYEQEALQQKYSYEQDALQQKYGALSTNVYRSVITVLSVDVFVEGMF